MIYPISFKSNLKTLKNSQPQKKNPSLNCEIKDTIEFKGKPYLQKGQYLDAEGKILNRHTTSLFRDDMNWDMFSRYLKTRFDKAKKVDTKVYACSDGSEAYAMSIVLQDAFQSDSEKFFPIDASDISQKGIKQNIKEQKNRKINLTDYRNSQIALYNGTEKMRNYISGTGFFKTLKDNVTDKINFRQANILEDIEAINPNTPTIIMARNMWPYVVEDEYEDFANKLYQRLSKGSIVVLGSFDMQGEPNIKNSDKFRSYLLKAGFKSSKYAIGTENTQPHYILEKN